MLAGSGVSNKEKAGCVGIEIKRDGGPSAGEVLSSEMH